MSNVKDVLDQARSEAQALHKKIEASTAKDQAALRADIADSAAKAQQLATLLKTTADGHRADAKQHMKDAATKLEDATKDARSAASASEAQLKQTNMAMLEKARKAVQSLSHAVASQRSAAKAKV